MEWIAQIMQLALFEPEIPPNTGSIARLCAAVTTRLNLIEPLGFSLEDRYLRRAGLDYWPSVDLAVWPDWDAFTAQLNGARVVVTSARRGTPHHRFRFRPDDVILLGPETRGLPEEFHARYEAQVRIPIWGKVRSINLACAASALLFEGLRQTGALDARDIHPDQNDGSVSHA